MKSSTGCSRPRLVGLVIVTSLLSACAIAGSEAVTGICPPVVEYDAEFQVRAAEKVQVLPDGSAIAEMLSDYAVMRGQARGCNL